MADQRRRRTERHQERRFAAFDSSAGLTVAYFQGFDTGAPAIREPLKLARELPSDVTDTQPPDFDSQVIDKDFVSAESVSMARGLLGPALIAYADHKSRTVHAWVNELSGLPPRIEVVAQGNVTNGPRHPSAAGNPHQNLFVAYLDNGQVVLARRTLTGEWTSQPVATGDGWPSLAFGKDGTAHLAYGTGKLMYARSVRRGCPRTRSPRRSSACSTARGWRSAGPGTCSSSVTDRSMSDGS